MTLQELLSEKGIVLDERCTLTTEDAKHMGNYDGESHGELMRVLQDFYDEHHAEVYDAIIGIFEEYLENKTK